MQAWWEAKPAPLTEGYEAFVASLFERDMMDQEAVDRWEAFVAGDGLPDGDSERPPEERYVGRDAESSDAD